MLVSKKSLQSLKKDLFLVQKTITAIKQFNKDFEDSVEFKTLIETESYLKKLILSLEKEEE